MVVGIWAGVVADPMVAINVRGVGMAGLVGVMTVFLLLWCSVLLWRSAVLWCSVLLLWCGMLLGRAVIRLRSARGWGVLCVAARGAAGVALGRGRMLGKQREREDGGDREI